jgi:hypothetical protein
MGLEVLADQRLQELPARRRQLSLVQQNLSQGLALRQHPDVHRRDEVIAADEVHLQRQDTEQQMPIGGGIRGRHGTVSRRLRSTRAARAQP